MIAIRSTRAKLAIGLVAGAGIAGAAGSACLTCTSERAVVALGSVVVDTNPKKVRSPAGGTIAEIRVRDGDWVAAGAVVMRLDDAVSRSNAAYLAKSLDELERARVRASTPSRMRWTRSVFPLTSPRAQRAPMWRTCLPLSRSCLKRAGAHAAARRSNCSSASGSLKRRSPPTRSRPMPRMARSHSLRNS